MENIIVGFFHSIREMIAFLFIHRLSCSHNANAFNRISTIIQLIDLHVDFNWIDLAIDLFETGFNSTGHGIRTCAIPIRG